MKKLPAVSLLLAFAACQPWASCGRKVALTFEPVPAALLAPSSKSGVEPGAFGAAPDAAPVKGPAINAHAGVLSALAFARDGASLFTAGYGDFLIRSWDVRTGLMRFEAKAPNRPVDMALVPESAGVAVLDVKGEISVWPLAAARFGEPWPLGSAKSAPRRIAASPNGLLLATTSALEPGVLVWDVRAMKLLSTLPAPEPGSGAAFSPDGKTLATGTTGNSIYVWDLAAGKAYRFVAPKAGAKSDVSALAFHPAGTILAAGHMDSTIGLWDAGGGANLRDGFVKNGSTWAAAFSPAGDVFATAHSNSEVRLWDGGDGRPRRTLAGHAAGVRATAFSPDGGTLASGDENGTLIVWRAR